MFKSQRSRLRAIEENSNVDILEALVAKRNLKREEAKTMLKAGCFFVRNAMVV